MPGRPGRQSQSGLGDCRRPSWANPERLGKSQTFGRGSLERDNGWYGGHRWGQTRGPSWEPGARGQAMGVQGREPSHRAASAC